MLISEIKNHVHQQHVSTDQLTAQLTRLIHVNLPFENVTVGQLSNIVKSHHHFMKIC